VVDHAGLLYGCQAKFAAFVEVFGSVVTKDKGTAKQEEDILGMRAAG
jgi:hypothetical protein